MDKRGQLGFSIITIYRVLIIIVISVVILGVSSLVYSHHINIRDSEAMILVKEISDCMVSDSVVDIEKLNKVENIFEYCGFSEKEMERFFVSVSVKVNGKEVFEIEGGDSGLLWVRDIFMGKSDTGFIDKYEPGNFKWYYSAWVLENGIEKEGVVFVEVAANVE